MVWGFSSRALRAGRRWLAPAGVLIACAGLATPAAALQPQAAHSEAAVPPAAREPLAVLETPGASPAALQEAARVLLGQLEDPGIRGEIQRIINGPATPGWRAVLDCVRGLDDGPPVLFPCITQRLTLAPAVEMEAVIGALGSYRTRDSVRILGRYLGGAADPTLRRPAMEALARLSARDDIGLEPDRWAAFVVQTEGLTEAQWRGQLIEALTARERRTEARRQDTVGQLVEALRKLHLATAPGARPELLASLLLNDTPEVQSLGFELVGRELSLTGRLDGPVGGAALKLLEHGDPRVRGSAAVLVRQLAPEGADERVAAALQKEFDPHAASDLLLAAARWPTPATVNSVLRWIRTDGPARESAFEAARWLFRAGELQGDAARVVLEAARSEPVAELTPAAISLLSSLGGDDDRARLVPLLASEQASIRQAAGEALVWYPEFSGAIITAAQADTDLFDLACRSVLAAEPTEDGVRHLLMLPRPSWEVAGPTLLRTANALSARELLDISRAVDEPMLRRGLLTLITAPTRLLYEKADPEMLRAIAEGVVDLADLELAEHQPEAALAVLDNAGFADALVEADVIASVRCAALLALGHVDLARGLQAPAAAWVRGLDLAGTADFAGAVLAELEARYGSVLNQEQRARVDELKRAIDTAESARRDAERATRGG